MAYKYPNLAAEISRNGINYLEVYEFAADEFGKSTDTISNWITGRAGELPTEAAFAIRDKFFPTYSVDYLFSEQPIVSQ